MSHEIQHNFAANDAHTKSGLIDDNAKNANDAMIKQVQTAQYGFLNGMTEAFGGTASKPAEKPPEPKDQVKPQDKAIHDQALAFGMANDTKGDAKSDVRQESSNMAEHMRSIAFESVYASAINNPRNQSGMPGRGDANPPLDWKSAPQMSYSGQQLQWAKSA
jgi:hypothetical protein